MPFLQGAKLKEVYRKAHTRGYGFVASNFAEPNVLIGLLEAAGETNSDLVLQMSHGAATFAGAGNPTRGLRSMVNYIRELAEDYQIGVFLNLDHITYDRLPFIKTAAEEGLASSIMIDASKEPFSRNVKFTREVVELTAGSDILIEGELGKIKGIEDEDTQSDEAFYTKPEEALEFVKKTGVDLLAISIGTQHGVSKGRDITLDTDRAKQINQALAGADLNVPLVLHGSSGLVKEQIEEILEYGICKLNKDTRYQYEYARTALDFYNEHRASILPPENVADDREGFFASTDWSPNKSDFDPRVVSDLIRERIKITAKSLFKQAGSINRSLHKA